MSERDNLEVCYALVDCDSIEATGFECNGAEFSGPDCKGYRLPSEAEWEAVAGMGSGQCVLGHHADFEYTSHPDWSCGAFSDPPAQLRYCENSDVEYEGCINAGGVDGPECAGPGSVREYPANALGVFGMNGNVRELTGSRYFWPLTWPAEPISVGDSIDPGYDSVIVDDFLATKTALPPPLIAVRGGDFAFPLYAACSYTRRGQGMGRAENGAEFHGFRLVRTLEF